MPCICLASLHKSARYSVAERSRSQDPASDLGRDPGHPSTTLRVRVLRFPQFTLNKFSLLGETH